MSPTSKFPPTNAKLNFRDWALTNWLLKIKTKELGKTRRGQVSEQIWLMEQIIHLRELKNNNLPYILGNIINPTKTKICKLHTQAPTT